MKKQYTAPAMTVTSIQTTILAGSTSIDMSANGIDGAQAMSRRGWHDWDEDEYEFE